VKVVSNVTRDPHDDPPSGPEVPAGVVGVVGNIFAARAAREGARRSSLSAMQLATLAGNGGTNPGLASLAASRGMYPGVAGALASMKASALFGSNIGMTAAMNEGFAGSLGALQLASLAASKGTYPGVARALASTKTSALSGSNIGVTAAMNGRLASSLGALQVALLGTTDAATATEPETAVPLDADDLVSDFRFQQLLRWYASLTEKQRRAFNDRFLALVLATCCVMSTVSANRSLVLMVDGMGVLLSLMALCSAALDTFTDD
jgi:hypothetical protein